MVGFKNPAGQHHTPGLDELAGDLKTKAIQANESGQIRRGKGSVRHVEVFQMGGVTTPIIGRPQPLPTHQHTTPSSHHHYTLNSEEPQNNSSDCACAPDGLMRASTQASWDGTSTSANSTPMLRAHGMKYLVKYS